MSHRTCVTVFEFNDIIFVAEGQYPIHVAFWRRALRLHLHARGGHHHLEKAVVIGLVGAFAQLVGDLVVEATDQVKGTFQVFSFQGNDQMAGIGANGIQRDFCKKVMNDHRTSKLG